MQNYFPTINYQIIKKIVYKVKNMYNSNHLKVEELIVVLGMIKVIFSMIIYAL